MLVGGVAAHGVVRSPASGGMNASSNVLGGIGQYGEDAPSLLVSNPYRASGGNESLEMLPDGIHAFWRSARTNAAPLTIEAKDPEECVGSLRCPPGRGMAFDAEHGLMATPRGAVEHIVAEHVTRDGGETT